MNDFNKSLNVPWKEAHAHNCQPKGNLHQGSFLLFPPVAFPFLFTPSFSPSSIQSPTRSVFPSVSLSLCEGHTIDFPLSIHFSRLALKRGKQTKATPAPPLHPSPPPSTFLPSPLALVHPESIRERMWRNATPPLPRHTHLLLHLFLLFPSHTPSSPLFCLYSFNACPFPSSPASFSLSATSPTTFH